VFSYKLSENTELRLREERHAHKLTDLTAIESTLGSGSPGWTQTAPSRN